MGNNFINLSDEQLYNINGGGLVLGMLTAAGIVCGTALVVGGVTYGVKKACEYVGSLFK